ncbi:MAG: hypothetical protein OXM02_01525 [Bacteroidota bacterium]|nr:hypothetical protein [Bacteroidota bacterium]
MLGRPVHSGSADQTGVQPEEPDYSRDIEFLDFLIDGLKRREELRRRLAADIRKIYKPDMLDDFIDIHCGPWGVSVPDLEHSLLLTWHNAGSLLRRAKNTVGRRTTPTE